MYSRNATPSFTWLSHFLEHSNKLGYVSFRFGRFSAPAREGADPRRKSFFNFFFGRVLGHMMPTGAVAVCRPVAVRTWYTGRFPFDPGSVECHDLERNTLVDDDAPHEEFNRLGHAQTIPHNTRSLAALTSGVTRIWI